MNHFQGQITPNGKKIYWYRRGKFTKTVRKLKYGQRGSTRMGNTFDLSFARQEEGRT